jgi:hypothetical protein
MIHGNPRLNSQEISLVIEGSVAKQRSIEEMGGVGTDDRRVAPQERSRIRSGIEERKPDKAAATVMGNGDTAERGASHLFDKGADIGPGVVEPDDDIVSTPSG